MIRPEVLVVTPNPAVDVTYVVDRLVLGEHVRVRHSTRKAGGKGVNVASVVNLLGGLPTLLLPLGGDTGAWLASQLAAQRIDTHIVEVAAPTRSTVTVLDVARHPTMLTEPGQPLTASELDELVRRISALSPSFPAVVLSGSVPEGTTPEQVRRLVEAARARGAVVVVDTSGPALLAAADAGADVLKPNEAEALGSTGASSVDDAVEELLDRGAKAVVVSRGAEGLVAVDRSSRWVQPAVPGVEGNPTGAGDAATAAMALVLAAGGSLPEALRAAAATGAAAVLQPVAGTVDVADVRRFEDAVPQVVEVSRAPRRP